MASEEFPRLQAQITRWLVKLDEEAADGAIVVERKRSKFLPLRNSTWRLDVAWRIGLPILGAVVAVALGWLISRL